MIRYRSAEPVLTPMLPHECHGTIANVVFPTGINRRDDLGLPDRVRRLLWDGRRPDWRGTPRACRIFCRRRSRRLAESKGVTRPVPESKTVNETVPTAFVYDFPKPLCTEFTVWGRTKGADRCPIQLNEENDGTLLAVHVSGSWQRRITNALCRSSSDSSSSTESSACCSI